MNIAAPGLKDETSARVQEKLRRELGIVADFLSEPDVSEIMLNPDGRLWVERFGRPSEVVGALSPYQAEAILTTIAAFYRTTITRERPRMHCEIPFDGSRLAAAVPPIVAAPIFTIRRHARRVITLAEYVESGALTDRQRVLLEDAIDRRLNILVIGGTQSGKTTFVNALIRSLSDRHPHHRLVIIEDTGELQCSSQNQLTLRSTEYVSMQDLLEDTLRHRPDRIIVGEVRSFAAMAMIDAWNTGHPGGFCTAHANTEAAGLLRIESLIRLGLKGAEPPRQQIAEAINLIVAIEKTPSGRRVSGIVSVHGHDGQRYITTPEE